MHHDRSGGVSPTNALHRSDLAYRLFDVCGKKKRSQAAQGYNALALGWPEIARLARETTTRRAEQPTMFGGTDS